MKLNNVLSDSKFIKYGVPQGSVLGPILFILYINEVCDLKIDGTIVTYADDTCLLFTDSSWNGVHNKATKGLNSTYLCIKNRGLSMNFEKSMFINFSINKCTNTVPPLVIHNCDNLLMCNNINCKQIQQIMKIRYLGIIFDENLRWNLHICNLVGKLCSTIHQFIKLRDLLPVKTMCMIYFAFYQSIFQYGLLVWGGIKDNYLNPLQVNQNSVVRIILGKKSLKGPTKLNYKLLGILPAKLLYKSIALLFTC